MYLFTFHKYQPVTSLVLYTRLPTAVYSEILKNIYIYLFVCSGSCLRHVGSSSLVIKPGPPALGAWSLSHRITREVLTLKLFWGPSHLPYHFTYKCCSNLSILVFIKYCYFLESVNLSFWLSIIISILITVSFGPAALRSQSLMALSSWWCHLLYSARLFLHKYRYTLEMLWVCFQTATIKQIPK